MINDTVIFTHANQTHLAYATSSSSVHGLLTGALTLVFHCHSENSKKKIKYFDIYTYRRLTNSLIKYKHNVHLHLVQPSKNFTWKSKRERDRDDANVSARQGWLACTILPSPTGIGVTVTVCVFTSHYRHSDSLQHSASINSNMIHLVQCIHTHSSTVAPSVIHNGEVHSSTLKPTNSWSYRTVRSLTQYGEFSHGQTMM